MGGGKRSVLSFGRRQKGALLVNVERGTIMGLYAVVLSMTLRDDTVVFGCFFVLSAWTTVRRPSCTISRSLEGARASVLFLSRRCITADDRQRSVEIHVHVVVVMLFAFAFSCVCVCCLFVGIVFPFSPVVLLLIIFVSFRTLSSVLLYFVYCLCLRVCHVLVCPV